MWQSVPGDGADKSGWASAQMKGEGEGLTSSLASSSSSALHCCHSSTAGGRCDALDGVMCWAADGCGLLRVFGSERVEFPCDWGSEHLESTCFELERDAGDEGSGVIAVPLCSASLSLRRAISVRA